MSQRALLDTEKACLQLLKNWETAIRERRLTLTLNASRQAAEVVGKYDSVHFKILKSEWVPATSDYRITFTLIEFRRYIEFILPRAGLKLEIDGCLRTMDNLRISNSYLGSEMEAVK